MGAIDWAAFKVRRATNGNHVGYWLYTRFLLRQGKKHYSRIRNARAGIHSFVIDGYPRSGNTFLASMASRMFERNDFLHHMHSSLGVRYSIHHGKNIYLLFRAPEECCASRLLLGAHKHPQKMTVPISRSLYKWEKTLMLLYLREYIQYYAFALRYQYSVKLIHSQTAFESSHELLKRIALENEISTMDLSEARHEEVVQEYFKSKKAKASAGSLAASIPTNSKQRSKRRILSVVEGNPLLERARLIYEDMKRISWPANMRA